MGLGLWKSSVGIVRFSFRRGPISFTLEFFTFFFFHSLLSIQEFKSIFPMIVISRYQLIFLVQIL